MKLPDFTKLGVLVTKITGRYCNRHRYYVVEIGCEFLRTYYNRSYLEGVRGVRAHSIYFVLEKW
jgi:hypothetical protein